MLNRLSDEGRDRLALWAVGVLIVAMLVVSIMVPSLNWILIALFGLFAIVMVYLGWVLLYLWVEDQAPWASVIIPVVVLLAIGVLVGALVDSRLPELLGLVAAFGVVCLGIHNLNRRVNHALDQIERLGELGRKADDLEGEVSELRQEVEALRGSRPA